MFTMLEVTGATFKLAVALILSGHPRSWLEINFNSITANLRVLRITVKGIAHDPINTRNIRQSHKFCNVLSVTLNLSAVSTKEHLAFLISGVQVNQD